MTMIFSFTRVGWRHNWIFWSAFPKPELSAGFLYEMLGVMLVRASIKLPATLHPGLQ